MHLTMSNGLTTPHSQPAESYTLSTYPVNYPIGSPLRKEEATLAARLALAGFFVMQGRSEDYTVCKYGLPQHCQDLSELHAFSVRLGVCHV
jgi:hypothetical protein